MSENSVGTLARGLDVLELFAIAGSELSQKEISEALGLPMPTVHRLTALLTERGWLDRDPGTRRLRLGLEMARLVPALLDGLRLPELARPHLLALTANLQETVNVAILQGAEVVYLLSESGDRLLTSQASVGMRLPAHCTALGKCLLAQLPEEVARDVLGPEPYEPRTARTVTTWAAMAGDLASIRDAGVAVSEEEYEVGLVSIAVPVRWIDGPGSGAINVSLPAGRATPEFRQQLTGGLLDAARAIDREMNMSGGAAVTVEAAPGVEELAEEADGFARSLADVVAADPALRYQGMPSDGDSHAVYRALGEAGWIGIHWPQALGGRGLSSLHTVACEERFGYRWLPLSGYLLSVKTIGNALLRFAGADLQERLVPEVAAGRMLFCQGFSEPDAGSDLASLRTRARLDDGRFIVSGRKIWTSSADYADWVYLAVRTTTDRERHRGISVLVADITTPGITVRTHRTLGGGTIGELELTDVEIPAGQIVGELHGGWRVLMGTLDYERVTSEKVGTIFSLLDALGPLAGDPRARRTLRRLRGAALAARLHGRRAAELLQAGRPASEQSSMAKLSIAELMQQVAAFAVELLGPAGLLEEGVGTLRGRVAAFQRASVATTISGGAAEIQRTVIARRGLACPPR